MNKYFNYNNLNEDSWTPHGNEIEDVLEKAYDEQGVPYLKKVGERNIQEEIQSHEAEVDIKQVAKVLYESGQLPNISWGDEKEVKDFTRIDPTSPQAVINERKTLAEDINTLKAYIKKIEDQQKVNTSTTEETK